MISTGSLIAAGLVAAGSAGMSAYNRSKARNERESNFRYMNDLLTSEKYRDPLNTMSSRWLLKAWNQDKKDELEALNNRVVAGGATMENQLAGRNAINKRTDNLYGQLLQGEDARRDRIESQRLALANQNSLAAQNEFRQAAQDWSQWGQQTAGAILSYGGTGLLNGAGAGAAGAAASAAPAVAGAGPASMASVMEANADLMQPIIKQAPGYKQGLGGLAGQ